MSSCFVVALKWKNGEVVITLNKDSSTVSDLSRQVFEKTRIPPDRQILMIPGLRLTKSQLTSGKEGQSLLSSLCKLQDKMKGTLFGTPVGDEFVLKEAKVDEENSIPHQEKLRELQAMKDPLLQAGYQNLGNTCYLGAVLAMLESVEELRRYIAGLTVYSGVVGAWKHVWERKALEQPASPEFLFEAMCEVYPEMGEKRPGSAYCQMQDAEECLTRLLSALPPAGDWISLFQYKMMQTCRVDKAFQDSHPELGTIEKLDGTVRHGLKLCCYMGTSAKSVSFMNAGIQLGMEDEIEKNHAQLGRNITYLQKSSLEDLPPYLIIHMVRFEWKKAAPLAGNKAGRAKIQKRVEYPIDFDVHEFCTENLKRRLNKGRVAEEEWRETQLKELTELRVEKGPPAEFHKEIADGTYKLQAVVTHMGRGASEGHYICWRWKDDKWIKMDDDKTSAVPGTAVDLQGGLADGHCPYILLYKRNGSVAEDVVSPSLPGMEGVADPSLPSLQS